MINYRTINKTIMKVKLNTFKGECIERQLEKFVAGEETIEDTSPRVYSDLKDGVLPEFDIRTDTWKIAQDAMQKVSESKIMKLNSQMNKTE